MSQEIVYTSAPQGLKAGSRGFCTVASTPGMAVTLAERLESLSGYRHLFPPQDAQARLNPVSLSHLQFSIGGRNFNVLSRIADAGLDYSQRSNKIAHHVALSATELNEAGPAWTVGQPGFMVTKWEGSPRILSAGRIPPSGSSPPRVCNQWARLTGDPGWGGVLAETLETKREVFIAYAPGQDLLPLLEETLALIAPAKRWDATFSTFYLRLPPGVTCQWKGVISGSEEALAAKRSPSALFLDLTGPLGRCPESTWVAAARSGQISHPAARPPRVSSAKPSAAVTAAVMDTTPDPDLLIDDSPRVVLPPHRPPSRSFQEQSGNAEVIEPPWIPPRPRSRWPVVAIAAILLLTAGAVAGSLYWRAHLQEPPIIAKQPSAEASTQRFVNVSALLEKVEDLKERDEQLWRRISASSSQTDNEAQSLLQVIQSIETTDTGKLTENISQVHQLVKDLTQQAAELTDQITALEKTSGVEEQSRDIETAVTKRLDSLRARRTEVDKCIDDIYKGQKAAQQKSHSLLKRLNELEAIGSSVNQHCADLASCKKELDAAIHNSSSTQLPQQDDPSVAMPPFKGAEAFSSAIATIDKLKARMEVLKNDSQNVQELLKEKRSSLQQSNHEFDLTLEQKELRRVDALAAEIATRLKQAANLRPVAKPEDFIALVPPTMPMPAKAGLSETSDTVPLQIFQWDERFKPMANKLRFAISSTYFAITPIGESREGKWTIDRQSESGVAPPGQATLQVVDNCLMLTADVSIIGELKGKTLTVICGGHKASVLLGQKYAELPALSIEVEKGWRIRQTPFEFVGVSDRDVGLRNVSLSFKPSSYVTRLVQTGTTDTDRLPVFVFFGPEDDPIMTDGESNPNKLARFRLRIDLAPSNDTATRTFRGQQVEILTPQIDDPGSPLLRLKSMDKEGRIVEHDFYKPFVIAKQNEPSFRKILIGNLKMVKERIDDRQKDLDLVNEQLKSSKDMAALRDLANRKKDLEKDLLNHHALFKKLNPFGNDAVKHLDAIVEDICGNLRMSLELGQLVGKPQRGKSRDFAPLVRFHD